MRALVHVGAWCATMVRAARIALVAAAAIVAYGVGAVRRCLILDADRRAHHRAHQRGHLLRWMFTRLGATFIKVGQVMSSRPDLLSAGAIEELRALQDRVPPFRFAQVRRSVEQELGAPLDQLFRELDPVPVAAGSTAQVHRAVLHDGDEVAVKVLRPDVRARIRRDGRILRWLAHAAQLVSARARTADLVAHVRNLLAGVLAQTDLREERDNYERFRRNFAGTLGVRFPRVYGRLSTRAVLTMEYIHGSRIDDAPAELLPAAARAIRSAFFAMCFDHGFVHADLHPGNLLVTDAGDVVMLDVGLVKTVPRELLRQMVDFTRCLAGGDAKALVAHLQTYHRYITRPDWGAVELDAAAFIARLRSRSMAELELCGVVCQLFALARKHGLRPMPELTLVLLGMVTNEGMAKRLDPSANLLGELAAYLGPRHAATPRQLARGSRPLLPGTASFPEGAAAVPPAGAAPPPPGPLPHPTDTPSLEPPPRRPG